jgi:DNA-binding transcriptional MocR family regulator
MTADINQCIDATWLADVIVVKDASGIADKLSQLIASGKLLPGTRLPTVRALADHLGASSGTIAAAWQQVRDQGLIRTHRRGGTVVVQTDVLPAITVPSHAAPQAFQGWSSIDMYRGSADPALQPGLSQALIAGLGVGNLHAPEQEHVIGVLYDALIPTWPGVPQMLTTVGGGTLGVMLALQAVTKPGDLVAIENPSSPRLLNILSELGLTPVAVACDQEGPLPDALALALRQNPVAFVYQIRAQMPAGHAVSRVRSRQLADVLEPYPQVSVFEDDHLGVVSDAPCHSLCEYLPDRTLLIRSYCRAFGVDLRISVMGGASALIEKINDEPGRGVAITSRITQGALAYLLRSRDCIQMLKLAQSHYAKRRRLLGEALRKTGFDVQDGTGLSIWIPVIDEAATVVQLARSGVIVAAGTSCFVPATGTPTIRVMTSRLPEEPALIDALASLIYSAVHAPAKDVFY